MIMGGKKCLKVALFGEEVANLFTGEYKNTLDDKGRIMFPSRVRCCLTGNVVILTQGLDSCLWLFPPDQWDVLQTKVMESASLFNAQARLVFRRLIAPAQEVEIDKSGRIPIPQSLREFAHLEKDCVILAINKYAEIWDSSLYDEYRSATEADFRAATENLGDVFL